MRFLIPLIYNLYNFKTLVILSMKQRSHNTAGV